MSVAQRTCVGKNWCECVNMMNFALTLMNCVLKMMSCAFKKMMNFASKRCELAADNGAFGDPCYGSAKYLAVVLKCSEGKTAGDMGGTDIEASRPALPPLPRVTMRQLQRRPDLLKGDKPYALLDGAKGWSAMRDWSVDYFLEKFGPDVKSDYFFDGKQQQKDIGRLVPFQHAVDDFHKAQGTVRTPYFLWYAF